jgi:hypothetical protein
VVVLGYYRWRVKATSRSFDSDYTSSRFATARWKTFTSTLTPTQRSRLILPCKQLPAFRAGGRSLTVERRLLSA